MILVLEDDVNRVAVLHQRMNEEQRQKTLWTEFAHEAVEILKDYQPSLAMVYLDHDLGGNTYVNSAREDCGMEVVRFLEKQDPEKYNGCHFRIHSWNEGAANSMHRRLLKAGYDTSYVPFGMDSKC